MDVTKGVDTLGIRMKLYESITTETRFDSKDILVVRLDGRSFSSFTRSLKSNGPFHKGFSTTMREVTKHLIATHNPVVGYTQSDEITLVFINNATSSHPFGGRTFKMTSLLAADASLKFTSLIPQYIPEKNGVLASFDCRVFVVPSIEEAYNCIVWRRKDGYRNAVSAVAREYFSANQLHHKHRKEQLNMLEAKGIMFHDVYDEHYRFGTFFARMSCMRRLTSEEIETLPLKHNARKTPDLEFERHIIARIEFRDLMSHLANKGTTLPTSI
ncbi:TRNAHis guanylyltransferase [uncultured virus]|nr:TRNAHis guanylyltransferase [uncultured virus]